MADNELTNVTDPDSVMWVVTSDPNAGTPDSVEASAWLDIAFKVRRRFDESKVARAKGRFAPKPGGGSPTVRRVTRKASAPDAEPRPAEAPAAAPDPTPVAPAPPPPPPVPTPAPAPPVAAAPEPVSPVVTVTPEVIDDLETSESYFVGAGDRVITGNRVGTVRGTISGPSGLTETLRVQFDDDPTVLTEVATDDTQLIEDADEFEDILDAPFPVSALSASPAATGPGSGTASSLPVTPGFDLLSADDATIMQIEMAEGAPWTVDQEEALSVYSGDGYEGMNGCLRRPSRCTDEIDTENANASAAMRPTTRATTVFRGANLAALGAGSHEDLAALVGATVSDPGFTSTSIDPRTSMQGNVRMQIEVPEGTRAAYIESLTENPGELELLLDSGTRFEIVEVVSPDDPSGSSTVRMRVVL